MVKKLQFPFHNQLFVLIVMEAKQKILLILKHVNIAMEQEELNKKLHFLQLKQLVDIVLELVR
ncbi:Uncharacterised protein [Chlamydia abortus]|nr:Uncharacterised protein [Chlamydia abortus]SGA33248.1 Uncharacterised protein [Chlamydia abortus]SHE15487.1 Uncharacterised protein [Chlamydia abortus]